MTLKNIIYFHYPCQDGLASAWVAIKSLQNYELKPYQHGSELDITFKNCIIYFLDMAPPIDIYNKLKEHNIVYILDHHISNKNDYEKNLDENVYFDMNLSGVGLTWKFFNPNKPIPLFLEMIQARDFWKFNIENTKEFCEALFFSCSSVETIDEQFKILDDIHNNNQVPNYVITGKLLIKQKNLKIKQLGDKYIKKIYNYKGHNICMVNIEYELASDLGNELSSRKECDFAVLWRYDHTTEKYNLSLRSTDKVDVSLICKELGGGGHKNAAGCSSTEHPINLFND